MRNQVARHMNTFNKNSVHADLRRASLLDDEYSIEEGLIEYNTKEEQTMPTPKWLQNVHNSVTSLSTDKMISKELLDKYKKDCTDLLPPNAIVKIEQIEGGETSPQHLLWMLDQIASDDTMSITKKHRWLGYIQGVLVMKGAFSVKEERDYTRSIFNGD